MASLGGVTLDNGCVWLNEFSYSSTQYKQSFTISGRQVLDISTMQTGRPVVIDCRWITTATLQALQTLPDSDLTLVLDDDRVLTVVLDKTKGSGISADPVIPYAEYETTDYWAVTVNLITV